MKELISHAIAVAFLLALVLLVVVSLRTVRDDYRSFIGKREMQEVCSLLKMGVERVAPREPFFPQANVTSLAYVTLPDRIGGMPYRARFVNATLVIESGSNLTDTCTPGFNFSYSGSTPGGRTVLNYTGSSITMRRT